MAVLIQSQSKKLRLALRHRLIRMFILDIIRNLVLFIIGINKCLYIDIRELASFKEESGTVSQYHQPAR